MEDMVLQQVLIFSTILAPIIMALVELVKKTVDFPKNYVPLVALIIGLVVGAIAYPFTSIELTERIWAGAFAGLSATGLFELTHRREGYTKGGIKNGY